MILLLVVKATVWSVSLGSGTSGGVLAPLLILGGTVGAYEAHLFGFADVGLWAMVGMASLMAGTMRAPFTGAVFIIELTHDLGALPLVFTASIAAVAVTVLLLKRSILTEKIARRGYHISREYVVDPLDRVRVREVMDDVVQSVPDSMPLETLARLLRRRDPSVARHHALAVVDHSGRLTGIITRGDVMREMERDEDCDGMARGVSDGEVERGTVGEIASRDVIAARQDETIRIALRRMLRQNVGRLIVVDDADPMRPIGYLGRQAILDAQIRFLDEEYETEPGLLRRILDPGRDRAAS